MEYFVVANSFAAPMFSDTSEEFVRGKNPLSAMKKFVKKYSHPCGLYAANLYKSPTDYHKDKKRLAYYLSNVVIEMQKHDYTSIKHTSKDKNTDILKLDGTRYEVKNPRKGKCFKE